MSRLRFVVETVAAGLLAVVVVVVLLQVLTRYVLHVSISWPEELARYVLVWLTFIGAAGAAARRALIVVDSVSELVPARVGRALLLTATLGGLTAVAILMWASLPLFGPASRTTLPGTGIPLGWVYLALPVGGVLLAAFLLSDLSRLLRGRPLDPDEPGHPPAGSFPGHG